MAELDPYRLLGVRPDADVEEIRAAYHQAALKYHPDAYPGDPDEGARLFREATEAYERVLAAAPEVQAWAVECQI